MSTAHTKERNRMLSATDDIRIKHLKPLIPPAILMEEIPAAVDDLHTVQSGRAQAAAILGGADDRLMVVVGPCSVHDVEAGYDYAQRLAHVATAMAKDLLITMRVYFEKPRTTIGWKGLINDPTLDGTFAINRGLRVARRLLRDTVSLGLPTATEFLDPITPQFIADLVSWAAIGARTTESQVHRELASGLSMPVGFKNGTGGSIQIAVDAIRASCEPHHFLSVTKQGLTAIVATEGNRDAHLILRGGTDGPNYGAPHVGRATQALRSASLPTRLMIDCSHANCGGNYLEQPKVARAVAQQIASGNRTICGVMLESFIEAGKQRFQSQDKLTYGQSITDGCISWAQTEDLLGALAEAVRKRRTQTQTA